MRLALAQINSTLGDFKSNAKKIIDFSLRAKEKRADVVIFPELSLFGYPPNDALEHSDLVAQQLRALQDVIKNIPKNITVIFGALIETPQVKKTGGKPYQNVAVIATKGARPQFVAKQALPSYDVFDETRFFEPGSATEVVKIPRVGRVAISVCEDMWCNIEEEGARVYKKNPLGSLKNIDLVVNISASPFSQGKMQRRLETARFHVKKSKAPFVYVNTVGGQDELIFDGRSFILDEKGKIVVQAVDSEEDLVISDMGTGRSEYRPTETDKIEVLRKALVLGIRDFVKKTGQKSVHLGLSGGIDSAVVAALCVDALGPSQVTGLLLPGPYSSKGSVSDSQALARNLGIKSFETKITPLYDDALKAIGSFPRLDKKSGAPSKGIHLVEQNLQARLRGLILMAFSNAENSLLMSTANKCELAVGYSTLYGDTNGALMPIGDLVKGQVYALAKLYNEAREIIPSAIIEKAPSAELAPDQKDQDSLPPYEELDEAVIRVVERNLKPKTKIEKWVDQKVKQSEFKRWQSPPILRVSEHSFGRGRRMPIAISQS